MERLTRFHHIVKIVLSDFLHLMLFNLKQILLITDLPNISNSDRYSGDEDH